MKKGYELVAMKSKRPHSVKVGQSPSLVPRESANISHGLHHGQVRQLKMSSTIRRSAHGFGCVLYFNSVPDIPLV